MIKNLHIENYRLFKNLEIPSFAQVNLIGGKNNVGKTALLETIRLLKSKGNESVLYDIAQSRGDWNGDSEMKLQSFTNKDNKHNQFIIGNLLFIWKIENAPHFAAVYDNEEYFNLNPKNDKSSSHLNKSFNKIRFEQFIRDKYLERLNLNTNYSYIKENLVYIPFTSENKKNNDFWSKISLTPKEDDVVKILQLIEPKIRKVRIDNDIAKVLLDQEDIPRPLKNLGDGVNRIFTLALALVNAKDSILLIDEFEVGLHHSIQQRLWEIVFEYAKIWNIQVFVTTHSQDTVSAFTNISKREEYKTMSQYLRLQKSRKNDDIEVVLYDTEILETAILNDIETR